MVAGGHQRGEYVRQRPTVSPVYAWCDSPVLPSEEARTITGYTYHEACLAELLQTDDEDGRAEPESEAMK
jgi:hypothetical protein